jgi:LAS superfamily LD-carboxypeptidase LdcB
MFEGMNESGKVPRSQMTPLKMAKGHYAVPEAAGAMDSMIAAAKADGVNIKLTDSYRSYDEQVSTKRRKGKKAATPGKSNHGWGVAFDIATGGYDSQVYQWLAKNAGRFGFVNPNWAQKGGNNPEPWHWEFWKQ